MRHRLINDTTANRSRIPQLTLALLCAAAVLSVGSPRGALAQGGFQPIGGGVAVGGQVQGQVQGGAQGAVAGGVAGGVAGAAAGGIAIDAQGVVSAKFGQPQSPKLTQQKLQAFANQHLGGDVNAKSKLRKVSLPRLEAAIEKLVADGQPVPPEMQFLAGIQRLDYVFLDPEGQDLVIAGPAEGFAPDEWGRVRGVTTGRPPLRLDDLMIALRALERTGQLGCSIDPDTERLGKLQQYIKTNSTPAPVAVAARRYQTMAELLGMQHIRVWGVPADSHFGVTLVEADWRMKRISMGLERPPVRGMKSHLELLGPSGNSLQRFWITPLYDAFECNADRTAYRISGQRCQLLSQEEYADLAGKRAPAAFTRLSTQRFAKIFTEKFPELAEVVPVFAETQNAIDLAILAALFKKDRLPQRAGWPMALLLDEKRATFARTNPPTQVQSVTNFKRVGRGGLIGLVMGGVVIDATTLVRSAEFKTENAARLDGIRSGALAATDAPAEHPWWWD